MKPVITDVKGTILQMLKDQNRTIEELAEYTGIKTDALKDKLSTGFYMNKFTVSQLQEIADFFHCDLNIDFVQNNSDKKVYHCKTIREVLKEGHERMSMSLFSGLNTHDDISK
ncbi:XRE family transcriptional regulator [Enterocloster bolteae]|jgi:hypothetical protein|uniref:XRE family transcriptional regulator n=1 Tax=Enterocloster bolteae TaxID=208479 RepID=A0A414ASW0_9FIRM|nr:XRE family transcriptional regulator [Enterocloster bolteae]